MTLNTVAVDSPRLLLLLALLVPLLVVLVLSYGRSRRDLDALQRMARTTRASTVHARMVFRFKRSADGALVAVAVTCVILAAAGVRWGEGIVEDTSTGNEVVAVVDLSRSMSARDAVPSRLGQGLVALSSLVEQLPGTRFAVVGFSDAAYLLVPFTDDQHALQQQLQALRSAAPALGGSDLEGALRYATAELAGRAGAGRTVLIVSDGESSAGDPLPVARRAGRRGVPIIAIPVGSSAGAAVPDGQGAPLEGEAGPVESRRDDWVMGEIARLSGGMVADPLLPGAVDAALRSLREREQRGTSGTAERRFRVARRPRYPLLTMVALLALGASAANRAVRWRDTF